MHIHQGEKASLYDWKVNEEVYLILFNKKSVKIDQYSNTRSSVP